PAGGSGESDGSDGSDGSDAPAGPHGRVTAIPALPGGSDLRSASGAHPGGGGGGPRELLETVGRLWSLGVPLDRTALDAGHRRVPLPPYPFQRGRHWADPPMSALLHRVGWEETALPDGRADVRSVLLTGPDAASVRALAEQLAAEGIRTHGTGDGPPDAVVLVAGAAPDLTDPGVLDRARDTALAAFRTAVSLLDETGAGRLLLLTEDVHTTGTAPERPRPAHALLTGLALALPQETPGLAVTGVDLCSLDTPSQRLAAVLTELRAGGTTGSTAGSTTGSAAGSTTAGAAGPAATVVWRAGHRLTRTVAPLTGTAPPPPLPPDGVFLITGGGGGIGAALARDLAGLGRPTLVLAGRSPRPPAGLIEELGALGATVHYRVADVSVERDVDALLTDLPGLDAVFHAAGVVRPGTLRNKTPEEMAGVLAAKTRGSVLLSRALRRHRLSPAVCVAFSSVSSVLPGLAGALGDYAAANAFLDAFAASERRAGRPWQSVSLAAFAETGLAAALGTGPRMGTGTGPGTAGAPRAGGRPLATAPALAALRTACAVDAAHLLIADLTPASPPHPYPYPSAPAEAEASPAPEPGAVPEASPGPVPAVPEAAERLPVHDHRTPPGDRPGVGADIAASLRRLLATAVRLPPADISDDEPFFSLGLDSLAAVDLVKQLERELGVPLPATLFFEYRTVRELAAHLGTSPDLLPGASPSAPPVPASADAAGERGVRPLAAAPVPDGTPFPLTPVQLALHTADRLHPDIPAHGYVRQTIRGPLDADLLGRALAALADRHTMLRIRIGNTTGDDGTTEPRQYVAPPAALSTWYEVRECPGGIRALEAALCNRPFDLSAESPLRAVLARESTDLAHLVLVIHHAAGDGYSLNILGEELWSLYTALSLGREPSLPALDTDFARYAAAVADERSSAAFATDQRYWSGRLASRREVLRLPYDGDPTAPPTAPLATHQSALDPALTAALRERAAAHGVTLFHLLLAVHVRCLARWSGQREIAVNVARARRETRLAGLDRLVGPLADTLPLLCEADPDEPVPALAQRLRDSWLESEEHAMPSGLDLARLLPGDRHGPRTVSPAGFSFARFPATLDGQCPVAVRPTAAGTATAATRLTLLCWEDGTILRLSWNFPVRLFDPTTVARLAHDFQEELTALAGPRPTDPPRPGAPMDPPRPGAPMDPPRPDAPTPPTGPVRTGPSPALPPAAVPRQETGSATIVRRLLARFRSTPDAVAVDTGTATLTYAELDRASRSLATRLLAHGVTPGSLVALLTEPGADTVVSVVAVLRAGAGWVPLDAGHPSARLADQIARSGARTVVCHAPTRAAGDALGADVTLVPVDGPSPVDVLATPAPDGPVDAGSIAYTIFTSGSTGRPKAVPITHRSMENYLDWAIGAFGYDERDRLAQTASICFDASVRQLLAPLLVGATVVAVPWRLVRDPDLLLTHVERTRITVWSSVPTLWAQLLTAAEDRVRRGAGRPDLSALRWIHVGGEALSPAHVRRWFDLFGSGQRIANLYGPTEATVNTTCHVIDARPDDQVRRLPIGRPVTGTEVEVAGPDGAALPPGEAGELLIAGTGLTPGYLGEPALTEAAFTVRGGRRWYRSGDRVRRSPDGTLEFLGRLDDQVKIRGHRVEPGEIEAVLQTHPDVAHAVVLVQDGRLIAAVTSRPGAPRPDAVALRLHLATTLPPYMLPARITPVDELPLTGTGKVDRHRLLALRPADGPAGADPRTGTGTDEPNGPAEAVRRTPPVTPTEVRLARIWSVLLQTGEVCREDDFFALGGDSLLVLEVFARLEREGGPLPRPTVVYRHRTLAALAAAIDSAAVDSAAVDTAGVDPGATAVDAGHRTTDPAAAGGASHPAPAPFPLTPGQRGFLLAEAIAPGAGSAWLTRLRLHGPLHTERFQTAVDLLVARHPMLRTVFPAGARPAVQQELPPSLRLPVDFETLTGPHQLDERIAAERARRFEPWAWPLLRLRVLTLAPDEHVLVVHAHHVIGDGYSAALLVRELMAGYDALTRGERPETPAPRSTFRDYTAHLARQAQATAGEQARPVPQPGAPSTADHGAADRWARLSAPYRMPVLRTDDTGGRRPAGHPGGEDGGVRSADRPARVPSFHSRGFVIEAGQVEELRALASGTGATLYAPLLTAYYRALAAATGRADLVLGLAVSGRDHPLPDVNRVFGPFATAVPVRPAGPGSVRSADPAFGDDLRRVVAEAVAARTYEGTVPLLPSGLPMTAQFFFTFLDFSALGPESGRTLTVTWDDSDSEFTPPPVGTDVFMAARLDGGRLRVTVRASGAAFSPDGLAALADSVRAGLTHAVARHAPDPSAPDPSAPARTAPARSPHSQAAVPGPEQRMDSALVGYLPSPAHLARLACLPEGALPREELRALLFPDGRPRLLETLDTPLGRSGFVCVPVFADELASGEALLRHTVRGVELASSLGARSVSLAGMIPSLTGYGFDVLRATGAGGATAAVTTGHAATVVSVVKTVHAALDATRQELGGLTVAFVGLGSIGASSLELLLTRAQAGSRTRRPPARLLLCDVPGSGPRLRELASGLRARGLADAVEVLESDAGLPEAVYEAGLIVTAVSGGGALLDIDRLLPGTTVVDDSFPHCFDTGRALARMRERGDVLVVGGGLLAVGEAERQTADGLPAVAASGYLAQPWLPGTVASCRLESLLHASGADVPLVRGLVDGPTGLAYWAAAEAAGTGAAPLHLLGHAVDTGSLTGFRREVMPGRGTSGSPS
ncbi:non-ribosomal peptide synthetase, partial [Streptomyces jumonjinensis]